MASVIINFSDLETAKQFAQWLDGQGEQQYWEWQDCVEERAQYTATRFVYDYNSMTKESTNEEIVIQGLKKGQY